MKTPEEIEADAEKLCEEILNKHDYHFDEVVEGFKLGAEYMKKAYEEHLRLTQQENNFRE